MRAVRLVLFAAGVFVLAGGLTVGQDKKDDKGKKSEEPAVKAKGQLPTYWKMLGLTEDQVQKVYKIQNKYNEEIDKLEAKIKEMKDKRDKERFEVLTGEQKKRLKDIIESKAGGGKDKDKSDQ